MIPDAKLAEWTALAEAATPGPWEYNEESFKAEYFGTRRNYPDVVAESGIDEYTRWDSLIDLPSEEDARFISASRTALPEAIAEIRELRAENERLRNDIARLDCVLRAWTWAKP